MSTATRNQRRHDLHDRRVAYAYIAPAIIAMLWVHLIPMANGIAVSLLNLNVYHLGDWASAPFVGLANYRDVIQSIAASRSDFLNSVKVSFVFTIGTLIGSYLLGLICALTMNEDFRGRNIIRGLMLLPYVTPGVVSAVTMRFLFQQDTGMVNYILLKLHLIDVPVSWLAGPNAMVPLMVTAIWTSWPLWFIGLLSALQTVPKELYEAADMDGAKFGHRLFGITLPSLRSVTSILLIVNFLWCFNDFTLANVLFGSSPSPSADVLPLHIYNLSFTVWDFGRGSAMSFLVMILLLAIVLVCLRVFRVGRGVRS
jgi:multiple sugar transport system permease protein